MNKDKILEATAEDISQINNLINNAYRGEASKKGWTNENGIIEGNRMNETEVRRMFESPKGTLIKYVNENNAIIGCCYLEMQDHELYLGTLTVSPEIQAQGIGKAMLNFADEYAKKHQCTAIVMTVVSGRTELMNWYIRHGYQLTGKSKPFPTTGFGRLLKEVELIELKKYFLS
ncbi:MAG TPA: GNAT family N-acetyltransferase [Cyclobacteriaceae bacterium]